MMDQVGASVALCIFILEVTGLNFDRDTQLLSLRVLLDFTPSIRLRSRPALLTVRQSPSHSMLRSARRDTDSVIK